MPRPTKEQRGPLADARYLSSMSAAGGTVAEAACAEALEAAASSLEGPGGIGMGWRGSTGFDDRGSYDHQRPFSSFAVGAHGSVQNHFSQDYDPVERFTHRLHASTATTHTLPATVKHQQSYGRGSLESAMSHNPRGSCDSVSAMSHAASLAGKRRSHATNFSTANWQALLAEQCSSMQAILLEEHEAGLAQATVQAVTGLSLALRAYAHRIESMRDEKKRLVRMVTNIRASKHADEKLRPKMTATKSAPATAESSTATDGWKAKAAPAQLRTLQVDAEIQTDPLPLPPPRLSGSDSVHAPPRPQLSSVEEGNPPFHSGASSSRELQEITKQDSAKSDWATDSVDGVVDGRDQCQAALPRATLPGFRASSPSTLTRAHSASPRYLHAPPSARSCWSVRFGKTASHQDPEASLVLPENSEDEEGCDESATGPFNLSAGRSQSVPPLRSTAIRPVSLTVASTLRESGTERSSTAASVMEAAQRARSNSELPSNAPGQQRNSVTSNRTCDSADLLAAAVNSAQTASSKEGPEVDRRYSNWEDEQEDQEEEDGGGGGGMQGRLTKRRTNVLDQIKGGEASHRPDGHLPRASSINLRSKSGTFGAYEMKLKPAWAQDTNDFEHHSVHEGKSIRSALLGLIDNSDEISYDLDSRLQPFVILPYSQKRFWWMLPGVGLILYDLVYIPMQVFESPSTPFTLAIAWIAVAYWSLDIPLSFFTGIYKSREGRIEMRIGYIASAYCTSWLPIDLVTVLPDWLGIVVEGSPEGSPGKSAALARFSKTLRIIRILRSVRLLRLAKLQHFAKDIKDRINSEYVFSFLQVCALLLILICVSHFLACGWYGIGQHGDRGWVNYHHFQDRSLHNMYMTSLHWSLAQFQGNMEVHPVIFEERVFAVVVLIIGLVGISSLLSSITNMMMELQNYKRESTTQWWTLCRYLREQHVSMTTVMRVKRFMKHVMSGNQVKRADVLLCDKLPDHLQMEIDFDVYGPTLEHHRFFSHYSEESPRCMKLLCHGLEMEFIGQGDTIFGEGEAAAHMYWVKRGKLLYTQAGGAGEEHVLKGASWVSEPVLWVQWVHVGELFSYAASELLTLSAEAFEAITMSQINAILFAIEYAQQFMSQICGMNQYHLTDLMQTRVEPISLLQPIMARRRFKSSHLLEQKTRSHLFSSMLMTKQLEERQGWCSCLRKGSSKKDDEEELQIQTS